MGFCYLLNTNADVKSFKTRFNIPHDVNISYCHEGDIEDQMAILEGGVRFSVDPHLLRTLSFYELSPD